jgi:hypothetical protein
MSSRDEARNDIDFVRRSKEIFERHVARTDGATRARLRAARARATRAGSGPVAALGAPRLAVAGALGAAALAVVAAWLLMPGSVDVERARFDMAQADDVELLLDDEELDLVEELEFYAWLEEQTQPEPADSSSDGVG